MSKVVKLDENVIYDTVVIGAGPAAVSAAIYAVRKGLKTAMIGEFVGGQMLDTNEIENIIGLPLTNGFEYSMSLEKHLNEYDVAFHKGYRVKEVKVEGDKKIVVTNDGKNVETKTIIVATGAHWKKLGIEGEEEYTGRGVHYCTTCDGPFYRNRKTVIMGGGNSGVESAIYLSGLASSVTLVEFMPELKADKVLQDKLEGVDVKLNTAAVKVEGGDYVERIHLKNRETNEIEILEVDGVFVEIGLKAESDVVKHLVEVNKFSEILIDESNMTSVPGIFAAGDCTNTKHKQIIIAMGEGAKAALSAFEYLVKK